MRSSFPIFAAAAFAATFALLPDGVANRAGQVAAGLCHAVEADAVSPARNWLGNLHGWSDSPLVLNWRALVAQTKGRELPAACEH
jgi:hypothetical protein